MNGCNGKCNQGRNCDCFGHQPMSGRASDYLPALLAVVAVGLVVAVGMLLKTESVARNCDDEGGFTAFGVRYECRASGVLP